MVFLHRIYIRWGLLLPMPFKRELVGALCCLACSCDYRYTEHCMHDFPEAQSDDVACGGLASPPHVSSFILWMLPRSSCRAWLRMGLRRGEHPWEEGLIPLSVAFLQPSRPSPRLSFVCLFPTSTHPEVIVQRQAATWVVYMIAGQGLNSARADQQHGSRTWAAGLPGIPIPAASPSYPGRARC